MEEPATEDIRAVKLLPLVVRALGKTHSKRLRAAVRELRSWRRSGSHRRDLDRDGVYEHNRAVELMDAWWPKLLRAGFRPTLGGRHYRRLQGLLPIDDPGFRAPSDYPSFSDGWYGYVSKDLRDVFGRARAAGGAASTAVAARERGVAPRSSAR